MKTHLLCLFILLLSLPMFAQTRLTGSQPKRYKPLFAAGPMEGPLDIRARRGGNYLRGVYHFRKSFSLDTLPNRFLVHVTADNRYKLFLNGTMVSLGPARGDVYNWSYETVDLSPWLRKGVNVLAAVVWNFAEQKPLAQVSFNQTGFLMQGNSATEEVVNTDASWLCTTNKAYAPWWKPVHGYYAVGACEQLDATLYPWGWEQPQYDDAGWKKARAGMEGAAKGGEGLSRPTAGTASDSAHGDENGAFPGRTQGTGHHLSQGFSTEKGCFTYTGTYRNGAAAGSETTYYRLPHPAVQQRKRGGDTDYLC
jgi:Alpha-L-rhamnosidase N-terminal domain.